MKFKDQRFTKPNQNSRGPSRFLYVSGASEQFGDSTDVMTAIFEQFGELDTTEGNPIDIAENRRYGFVSYATEDSAAKAFQFFHQKPNVATISEQYGLKINQVNYAIERVDTQPPPEPECISLTEDIHIPGLHILNDFITEEEEQELLKEFDSDSAPWKMSLQRRVQHYGFPFNYRTLMLDYTKPTPPLSPSCVALAERFNTTFTTLGLGEGDNTIFSGSYNKMEPSANNSTDKETVNNKPSDTDATKSGTHSNTPDSHDVDAGGKQSMLPLNQLTINEYWPGQGIASHTDTEACFGPVIFILNLNSDIVMNMTKNVDKTASATVSNNEKEAAEEADSKDATGEITGSTPVERKCIHLPRRSLLVLSGPARYAYSHGISLRKYDKLHGTLVPRGRRISFTFRHALRPGAISSSALQSTDIELDHVVKVYDNIAVHWNHTRGKRKVWWHRVKDFLDSLPKGTLLADVGSGDGKYFGINSNITAIGCDRSIKLLEVSQDNANETFCCDAVSLPYRDDIFDATVCIAVLHHLSTVERRYAVLSELVRITRPGGQIMIQAWALEQGGDSKRAFDSQDTMVPWKLNKRFLIQGGEEDASVGAAAAGGGAVGGVGGGGGSSSVGAVESAAQQNVEGNSAVTGESKGGKLKTAQATANDKATNDTTLSQSELESITGNCKHVKEEKGGDLVFQRYCHVYKEGELENLCSSIPNCVIDETGWDKGNWFVKLSKICDDRLTHSAVSSGDTVIPVLKERTVV